MKKNLPRKFYERDTAKVARELLGKVLIRPSKDGLTSGKIVETEAYYGNDDPASRASKKKTKINQIMWEQGGLALVYMVHANWLFNVTTEGKETPGAVLIRALEPLKGLDIMKKRRERKNFQDLTSGPGKLTQALNISKKHYGLDLVNSENIFISNFHKDEDLEIEKSHRIGVTKDLDRELRFYVAGNKCVSC
ncbi:hypothetical protein AKJ53_01550 [candidate division MSBL1 archaeon SCGC-AAA382F02]|uniref:Putative 3-methyladenine DNA glycosylase n=1 Tax=candidate division MSBL1 archaeon SCGC-AAA382F02 TaxID=1698282 RepID=A0A133VHV0_9EURY|nr:hypothetical protein AKJ53_01550 [candidate division MSBL1 archaeon SCGC-AAA382F02]